MIDSDKLMIDALSDIEAMGFGVLYSINSATVLSPQGDKLGELFAEEPIKSWMDGRVLACAVREGKKLVKSMCFMAAGKKKQKMPPLYIVETSAGFVRSMHDISFTSDSPAIFSGAQLNNVRWRVNTLNEKIHKVN